MTTLANLTGEECELLVEVLEAQQQVVQVRRGHSPDERASGLHREEVLRRLLWDARVACSPPPGEEAVRDIGSYA